MRDRQEILLGEEIVKENPYNYSYRGGKIDPYRIFTLYGITHPAQQHAIKKLLRAGRSVKPLAQDVNEAIETLQRWTEMIAEDEKSEPNEHIHIEDCMCPSCL